MAKAKTSNKSKQIMDVAHPNTTPADASSKPILVSNRPMIKDPMMVSNSDKEKEELSPTKNTKILVKNDNLTSKSDTIPSAPELPKSAELTTHLPEMVLPKLDDESDKKPDKVIKIIESDDVNKKPEEEKADAKDKIEDDLVKNSDSEKVNTESAEDNKVKVTVGEKTIQPINETDSAPVSESTKTSDIAKEDEETAKSDVKDDSKEEPIVSDVSQTDNVKEAKLPPEGEVSQTKSEDTSSSKTDTTKDDVTDTTINDTSSNTNTDEDKKSIINDKNEDPNTNNIIEEKSADDIDAEEAAKKAEHDKKIESLGLSHKYSLPINTLEKRKTKRFVLIGILLSLLLLVAWTDIAIDAGLISDIGNLPHTHLLATKAPIIPTPSPKSSLPSKAVTVTNIKYIARLSKLTISYPSNWRFSRVGSNTTKDQLSLKPPVIDNYSKTINGSIQINLSNPSLKASTAVQYTIKSVTYTKLTTTINHDIYLCDLIYTDQSNAGNTNVTSFLTNYHALKIGPVTDIYDYFLAADNTSKITYDSNVTKVSSGQSGFASVADAQTYIISDTYQKSRDILQSIEPLSQS